MNIDTEKLKGPTLIHLSQLSGILIPFGSIFGPIITYYTEKNKDQAFRRNFNEALNFAFYSILLIFITIPMILVYPHFSVLSLPLLFVISLLPLFAAYRSYHDEPFYYPFPWKAKLLK